MMLPETESELSLTGDRDRASVVGTLRMVGWLLTAVVLLWLCGPLGPLGSRIQEWRRERAFESAAGVPWAEITAVAQPMTPRLPELDLVVVTDYECAYCQASHAALVEFRRRRPDVGVGVLHFPLAGEESSAGYGARLAICGGQWQRFEVLHGYLNDTEGWRKGGVGPGEIATLAGLADPVAFEACVDGAESRDALRRHRRMAQRVARGTPVLLTLAGRRDGVFDLAVLEALTR